MEQMPRMVPLAGLDPEPASMASPAESRLEPERSANAGQGAAQETAVRQGSGAHPGAARSADRSRAGERRGSVGAEPAARGDAGSAAAAVSSFWTAQDPRELARRAHRLIEAQRSREAPPFSMVLFEDPDNPRPDELIRAFATLPAYSEWFAAMALTFKSDAERLQAALERRKAEVRQELLERWRAQAEEERAREAARLQQQFAAQLADSSERVRAAALTMIQRQLELLMRQQKPPDETALREAILLDPEIQKLQEALREAREMHSWMAHYAHYQHQLGIAAHGAKGLMTIGGGQR